jgi:hypothetical protein
MHQFSFLRVDLVRLVAVVLAVLAAPSAWAQCGGSATVVPANAPDGALLGERVAVRGGEMLVGAPGIGRAYIYRRQNGATPYALAVQLPRPAGITGGHEFGRAVAMDYDLCAVGAPVWSDSQGTVVLYTRNAAGTWSVLQQLTAPVQQPGMCFGSAIAIGQGYLVVGAPGGLNGANYKAGIAYLYLRQPDGTFVYNRAFTPSQPTAQVDGQFGQCVGISGNRVVIGAPGELYSTDTRRGSLYIFQRATDGSWPLLVRVKSATTTNTVRAFAVDCAVDGNFLAVREQSTGTSTADTLWMYSIGASGVTLEPSFTAGKSAAFIFDPVYDAQLVGTISIRENYLACGSRAQNRCDLYVRGASQWSLQTPYTSGSWGNVELGAGVGLGHDVLGIGMPRWVQGTNLEPGALWGLAHVTRNCDNTGQSDACDAMAAANSANDVDYDGIPNQCESTVAPSAAVGTLGTVPNAVVVSWQVVPSAIGYRVQRVLNGNTVLLGWPYAAEYTDTTAAPDTLYTYLIRSVDGANGFGPGNVQTTGWRPYPAPTGLTASDGTSGAQVTLAWGAVSGAPAYRVFRAVGDATPVEIAQTTTNAYGDTTAVPGTVYTYTVKVKGNLGDSPASNSDTGFRASTGIPTGVAASDGSSAAHVAVTWNAVAGATGYKVYRAVPGSQAAEIGSVAAGTLAYNDAAAVAVTTYEYSVAAVIGAVVGAPSSADTGWRNLPAPSGVSASDGDFTTGVAVNWASVAGATGYTIWRGPSAQSLVQIASVAASATTHTDASAAPGTLLVYAVRATHALGSTDLSASDTGWRNLDAPTGVTASDGAYTDRIRVTWTAVAGATGYRVLRLLPGGSETPLPDLPAGTTLFDDTAPGSLLSVRYRVRALSAPGATLPSVADFGWRNIPAPTGVAASDGAHADKVAISWNAIPGISEYRIRRSVGGGPFQVIGMGREGPGGYLDRSAPVLAACTYTVTAVHALGETAPSAADAGWINARAPVAQASDGTSAQGVQVKWPADLRATGFQVFAGTTAGDLQLVATLGPAATSWRDLSVAPAVQRTYAVKMLHGLGSTAVGTPDTGWRGPAAPGRFTASKGTYKSHVELEWKAVAAATGYLIKRRPLLAHGPIESFGPFQTVEWKDKTALPGVRYEYTVLAVCALGPSGASASDVGWREGGFVAMGAGGGAAGGIQSPPPAGGEGGATPDGDAGMGGAPGTGDAAQGAAPPTGSGTGAPSGGAPGEGTHAFRDERAQGDAPGAPPADSGAGERWDLRAPRWWPLAVVLSADETLVLHVLDTADARANGALVSAGPMRLDGVLRVVLDPAARVRAGDVLTLVSGSALRGGFRRVDLPVAPAGSAWVLERTETDLVLRVVEAK